MSLKKPDRSRKLNLREQCTRKTVFVITTGPYSGLADKAAGAS